MDVVKNGWVLVNIVLMSARLTLVQVMDGLGVLPPEQVQGE